MSLDCPRWFAPLAAAACGLLLALQARAQVELQGIRCELTSYVETRTFDLPVRANSSGHWVWNHNGFGNIVSNRDRGFEALPPGRWRHMGIDFAFQGLDVLFGQGVYAVAPGMVVFATGTEGQRAVRAIDGKDVTPLRGGVVVVKHVAPFRMLFELPARALARGLGAQDEIPPLRLRYLYSYYLHLDPQRIWVRAGDFVTPATELGRLYEDNSGFVYPPHLHFEMWSTCSAIDRNGYARPGIEFQRALDRLLIDPVAVWQGIMLVPDAPQMPYAPGPVLLGFPPTPPAPPVAPSTLQRERPASGVRYPNSDKGVGSSTTPYHATPYRPAQESR